MNTNIEKEHDNNLQFAKTNYEESQAFTPMIIVDTIDKAKNPQKLVALLADEASIENRFDIVYELGLEYGIRLWKKEETSIENITFISEAWVSIGKPDQDPKTMIRPSEDPNHLEALVSANLDKNQKGMLKAYEIKKTLKGENFQVEFKEMKELATKEATMGDSGLLNTFWDGVETINKMRKTAPPEIENIIKIESVENILSYIKKATERLAKEHGNRQSNP